MAISAAMAMLRPALGRQLASRLSTSGGLRAAPSSDTKGQRHSRQNAVKGHSKFERQPAGSKFEEQPASSKFEEQPASSKFEEQPASNKFEEQPASGSDRQLREEGEFEFLGSKFNGQPASGSDKQPHEEGEFEFLGRKFKGQPPQRDTAGDAAEFHARLLRLQKLLASWGIDGEISRLSKALIAALLGLLALDWYVQLTWPKSRGLAGELLAAYLLRFGPDVTDAEHFFDDQPAAQQQAASESGYLVKQQQLHGLAELPQRPGPRPATAKGICHYQLEQLPATDFALLVKYELFGPSSTISQKQGVFQDPSAWELPPARALFYQPPAGPPHSRLEFAFLQELHHLHVDDIASWHLIMHPADARLAVARGWCEFHPLAGRMRAQPGFVMAYAPRNSDEVAVLIRLLSASLEYAQHLANTNDHNDSSTTIPTTIPTTTPTTPTIEPTPTEPTPTEPTPTETTEPITT